MQFNIKKTKNSIKKMGTRSKQTDGQIRQTDGQKTHEKINITNCLLLLFSL